MDDRQIDMKTDRGIYVKIDRGTARQTNIYEDRQRDSQRKTDEGIAIDRQMDGFINIARKIGREVSIYEYKDRQLGRQITNR